MRVIHQNTFAELLALTVPAPLDPNLVLRGDSRWQRGLDELRACKVCSLDTETYGIEPWHPLFYRTNYPRLLQVGLPSGLVLVADLGGWEDDRVKRLEEYTELIDILRVVLPSPKVAVITANGKFEGVVMLYHFGIKIRNIRDVIIISQILWAGVGVVSVGKGDNRSERSQISHSLGAVCQRLGFAVDKTEQVSNWGWALSNDQLNYAATDASILFPVFEALKKRVTEAGCLYSASMECLAVSVFTEMEIYGSPVNVEKAKQLKLTYEEKLQEVLAPYHQTFGDVNYRSSDEFLKALNEKWPELRLTSTGVEVLSPLDKPETNAVLKARTMERSINTLASFINHAWANKPGEPVAVRGFYRQLTASGTGRSSCTDKVQRHKVGLSLQVTPGKIEGIGLPGVRSVIEAPEGYVMGIVDLSASHARIATEYSRSAMLMEIYNNDFDGHSIYASFFSELAREEYTRLRQAGKKIPESLKKVIDALGDKQFWTPQDIKALKKSNEVASAFRDIAKTILYSSLNGGVKGTILRSFISAGFVWFSEFEKDYRLADRAADKFSDLYPELVAFCKNTPKRANKVKAYFKDVMKRATKNNPYPGFLQEEHGKVTSLTGRYCYFPKRASIQEWAKGRLEVPYTDSISANWLLVESDVMKDWAYHVQWDLDRHPEYKAYTFNLVHDELDFICLEEYAQEVATIYLWHQIRAFRRWVKVIPVVENGPQFTDDPNEDKSVFNEWVITPSKAGGKAPWEMVLCKNYSEK